ncbi:MAG TPA: patatin-like phospholipase family protein [Chthoniobacterales bacterium]
MAEVIENSEMGRERERTAALERGYQIVRGTAASVEEMATLAETAKDARAFSLARKLFQLIRESPEALALGPKPKLKFIQRHALCTYKDDDLIADKRFGDALRILEEGDLLSENPSQETLGQAGAIHKTKWRLSGQRRDLERALSYYQRGAVGALKGDFGYTRINAAFVLDLLAKQEDADSPSTAQTRREQAQRLREEIVAELPSLVAKPENLWVKKEWWYGATLAEALFGLKRYGEARDHLREAIALNTPAWQLESTTRQMALLAYAQGVNLGENGEAAQTLAMLVGDSIEALRAITAGKVGLALSGGGFRASLFHIGVLARLAELDVLRHVEVLSCVSGGSIIGAHYYLEVRRLLQEKADGEIRREDYLEIVRRLERDFLAGVQKNLRGRLFAGWLANWKTLLVRGYTRTKYLGEMLETHIYSRVKDGETGARELNSLQIKPKGAGPDFNPKLDNWRRAAKAPILLLNSTSLNTGHVWQFAVSWMGEPPQSARSTVDSNDLLRRMYYREAPPAHQRVRLGEAVAASACVPALFDPIEFNGLFPDRRLRLVDGGVHDNQGTAGLLEQECSVVLVSDASGQMNSESAPSGNVLKVLMRSNSISMARVREAEFRELETMQRSSALTGLMFLHLKKDLEVQHVDWVDCRDPYAASHNNTPLTSYGIPKTVQSLLAGLRTDLDTFSDAEAYALMLSGYRMTATGFKSNLPDFPVTDTSRETWRFFEIEPTLDRAPGYESDQDGLRQILRVGRKLALKSFHLRPVASAVAALIPLLLVVAVVFAVVVALPDAGEIKRWSWIAGYIVAAILVILAILAFLQQRTRSVFIIGALLMAGGSLIARMHLWIFEPIFRNAGKVRPKP